MAGVGSESPSHAHVANVEHTGDDDVYINGMNCLILRIILCMLNAIHREPYRVYSCINPLLPKLSVSSQEWGPSGKCVLEVSILALFLRLLFDFCSDSGIQRNTTLTSKLHNVHIQ